MTRNAAYFAGIALALSLGFPCGMAFADDSEALKMTAYELQQEIEARQADLASAQADVDEASKAIEEDQKRIEELESQIPEQQKRSAAAARNLYKVQQQGVGVVDLLLSADSLEDFIAAFEYMDKISAANVSEMRRLNDLKSEVEASQQSLREKRAEADERVNAATQAMAAAQEAQAEVQRRIEEEARLQAQIAAEAAKMAEQERKNDSGEPASPEEGGEAKGADEQPANEQAPVADGAAAAEEPASSGDATIDEWTKRIDAYLAGSPLAGQGATFAKAAIEYGVDPRFSPAISFTESSKGLYCFKPHNAWGWGSSSWSSWEEAIYAHVAGLANGYGGQISQAAAKKYCPPNWKTWYDRTLAQMEMI